MCCTNLVRIFPNVSDLVDTLSDLIVNQLTAAVADRGRASLIVPGGQTPKYLFDGLAGRHAPWSQVDIALTDERWTPDEPLVSNEHLVRERLLRGRAAEAAFTSFRHGDDLAMARDMAEAAVSRIAHPFDVSVLGMGADGHVASLFPNGVTLRSGALLEAVHRPGEGAAENRLTLTAEALRTSRLIALLITGPEKLSALTRPAAGELTPLRSLMHAAGGRFEVFYAP